MFNKLKEIEDSLITKYKDNPDPWGFDPKRIVSDLKLLYPFYKYYFDVKIHNQENIGNGPYMVISNHTGQIPIDGILICTAFATELERPIILRPLVERFLSSLPFLGKWSSEGGAVLGDRINCQNLIKRNESVLIFPEGVKGIAKNSRNFYKLQKFTRGFLRIALNTNCEILPIAVVGAEEFFPFVYQLDKVARFFKIPALPLTANLFPLPSPIDIYIGKPYRLPEDISADATDEELAPHIYHIEEEIKQMTAIGLKNKRTLLSRLKK